MRLTIVPEDGFVKIDGIHYSGLDMPTINTAIHAVQWYGDKGEIEYKDRPNVPITNISPFAPAIAAWQAAHDAATAPPPPLTPEEQAIANRNTAKVARTAAVAAITVTTTTGHAFDGDEVSQGRMARAIIALQATSTPSVNWVLANNTVIEASVAELTEALALAGAAQAAIWVIE